METPAEQLVAVLTETTHSELTLTVAKDLIPLPEGNGWIILTREGLQQLKMKLIGSPLTPEQKLRLEPSWLLVSETINVVSDELGYSIHCGVEPSEMEHRDPDGTICKMIVTLPDSLRLSSACTSNNTNDVTTGSPIS